MTERNQQQYIEEERTKEFEPAITSALDLDFYKLTMAQFAFELYQGTQVGYEYKNRKTEIRVADIIPLSELLEQIGAAQKLKFTEDELGYLANLSTTDDKIFKPEFLNSLKNLELPMPNVEINDGQFEITVNGDWQTAIFWETYILSIVNELYNKNMILQSGADTEVTYIEGDERLTEKINRLKSRPDIKIIEFGTRRRFSEPWQEYVLQRMLKECPENVVGSSNVHLAQKFGLKPIGTMAHEVFMIGSGVGRAAYLNGTLDADSEQDAVRESHNLILRQWYEMYGESLSIALTDTFGTDFFFTDMTEKQAREWKGLRQDSGDPFEFGHKALDFYKNLNIDPKTKVVVFSDGLDIETMTGLQDEFGSVFGSVLFGWGTNLTNDLGITALSIVMKATRANGQDLVKLPDNKKKRMGKTEEVEFYEATFQNHSTYSQECVY